MELQRLSNSQIIIPNATMPLGYGGEARIYALKQDQTLVAKVYHQPTDAHTNKLMAMLTNPPDNPTAGQGHISIAWPVDLLVASSEKKSKGRTALLGEQVDSFTKNSSQARIVGFLMPRVMGMRPILDFYNPKTRRQHCPLFNYLYLHRTARNLAAAMGALHARGYCIGDVNESNILASNTALVTLVDTDSFQVPDPRTGIVYRCPVGKSEFTPPELQGKSFTNLDRTPEHDLFGLAVLIFQLLMEGTHPFSGIFQGPGDPPSYEARIAAGHFPHTKKRRVPYVPAQIAPPWEILHPTLAQLFVRCFEDGHQNPELRPTAQHWQDALAEAEKELIICAANNQHRYGKHLNSCPWCDRTLALGGRDPFPSWLVVQNGQHLQPKPSKRSSQLISGRKVLLLHPPTPTGPTQKPILAKILAHKRFIPLGISLFLGMCGLLKSLNSTHNLSFASETSSNYFLANARVASSKTDSLVQNNQGDTQLTSKDYQIEIEKSNQLLYRNPNDAKAYVDRGRGRYSLRDYWGASEDFSQALHLEPNNADAYVNRGITRYEIAHYNTNPDQEFEVAIEDFNQALRLNPKYAEAYVKRGIVRYKLAQSRGDIYKGYLGAIEDFNQALRLNPHKAEAFVKRGLVRYQIARVIGRADLDSKQVVADLQAAANLFRQQGDIHNYQQALGNIASVQNSASFGD